MIFSHVLYQLSYLGAPLFYITFHILSTVPGRETIQLQLDSLRAHRIRVWRT